MMKQLIVFLLAAVLLAGLSACNAMNKKNSKGDKEMKTLSKEDVIKSNRRAIYLAGGCFWGVEGYFKKLPGVYNTETGYANGKTSEASYNKLKMSDHAETVKIEYDMSRISLTELLLHYFRIIDPKSVNKQGNDEGRQYRTGIYYPTLKGENNNKTFTDSDKLSASHLKEVQSSIKNFLEYESKKHGKLAVENQELKNFVRAEDYHQDYLEKNPNGYCHINLDLADKPLNDRDYPVPNNEELKKKLGSHAYNIMKKNDTERPFSSPLNDQHKKGIYVDKITGEPLFSSSDKFESGCGWPSFSKPILSGKTIEKNDTSHGMNRTEVRTKGSDSHLGHVFNDGPAEKGGLRYCINGAALEFIPYEKMDERNYGFYKIFCE
ncbi:MAG: peptide-methionine (R)-S-oxide reductase MsrB [Hornefia sp.]|nr:peptide-methionine (R)-S-oxide reductase MsrB [Hornefia sp.]